MKRALSRWSLAALAFSMGAIAPAAEGWLTSWDDAVKESRKSGKPILADFTGSDWCGWCKRLDKEVFGTPEFKAWAKKNVVLLEVDFPQSKKQSATLAKQNQTLLSKYKVEGFPTILFLNADGKKLAEYGYDEGGPKKWTERAATLLKEAATKKD